MRARPFSYLNKVSFWIFQYQSGLSYEKIAEINNVKPGTVYAYLKRFNIIEYDNIKKSKIGSNNPKWKGDNVGYQALHAWVKRRKTKPDYCELCKNVVPYDLANISQKYKRNLTDWEWLCRRCHMIKDGRMKNLKQYV